MSDPARSAMSAAPQAHRGRLFRKYLLLIISLVSVTLLVSSGLSLYFSYQENRAALASLQREKAIGAASRIEHYIRQISPQLVYAALPQIDASDVELRRIEFLKLLRQAPEVTDFTQLDATGKEQISVSRLGMHVVASVKDRPQEPAFLSAKRGQPWFGPVYFRKATDSTRLVIVGELARGPASVSALAAPFAMAFPSFMKHLVVLERMGVIRSHNVGRIRTCELRPNALTQAEQWMAGQRATWEARSDRMSAVVENLHQEQLPHAKRHRRQT